MIAWRQKAPGGCEFDRVVRGVEPSAARQVAELFWDPFGRMLAGLALPKDRDQSIELLSRIFCLSEVYAAIDADGQPLGIAFVPGRAMSLCIDPVALSAAYGSFGGWWRAKIVRFVMGRGDDSKFPTDHRSIEGFSVSASCRGKGIGTKMIDQIIADARAEGVKAIELNVGDINPARHLYERSGFKQTRTQWVGPFAGRLGFTHFVYYELLLQETPE